MIKSLLNSGSIAYEFSGPDSWAERGRSVIDCLREYPTYGDGTVKHGNSYKVPAEHFVDALLSVYDYLTSGGHEDIKKIESYWPQSHNPGDKKIAFFAGLKYVEGKRRFYEKDTLKVTSSVSKQYDTRWGEVPTWADGTFDATWRLVKDHCWAVDFVNDFSLFEAVKDWYDANMGCGFANTYERNGIGTDADYHDVSAAFRCLDCLIQAHRENDRAKRIRECLQWNLVGKYEQHEQEVEAA